MIFRSLNDRNCCSLLAKDAQFKKPKWKIELEEIQRHLKTLSTTTTEGEMHPGRIQGTRIRVNQRLKSPVREIRTPGSVGLGSESSDPCTRQ
jgi:hypothetical protein